MAVIAVVTDLIFSTKITGTAKALGKAVSVARTLSRLTELLAPESAPLVLIDLNAANIDVIEAIKIAKSKNARVIAYLSHVQVDLAEQAKSTGADEVLPRSAFVTKLPSLLQ